MRAFLSHSSDDREFVLAVYNRLQPDCLWIDRAELEWGDIFLERIEEGIRLASDFVLFWSKSSAHSEWVRLETNMAFMELTKRRAIRLRVVRLDATELPLRLEMFHFLSIEGSDDPVSYVESELRNVLAQPSQGVRNRFLNRNSELERIEQLINDSETRAILLQGFQGIGKGALAHEALTRLFQGASIVEVTTSPGVGPTELALRLHHEAFGTVLPEMTRLEALAAVESAVRLILARGQFLIFRNVQHWLDGERELEEPLSTLLRQLSNIPETTKNPIFLTSTRTPSIPVELATSVGVVRISGLQNDHMASLVSLWFQLGTGHELESEKALSIAGQLHGHPVAAKMASNLVAQYGTDHLLDFPKELIGLRRDLAKLLISEASLSTPAKHLLETMAIVGVPVPSRVLVNALATDEESFHSSVANATGAGIAETTDSGLLTIHPLVSDYFWRSHLDHEDYKERASTAAAAVEMHLRGTPLGSAEFVSLLPIVFRLFALSGDFQRARAIRSDLTGELSQAAITHYQRRQFTLAESYVLEVLGTDPQNWRMRQTLARIRVRQRRWDEADQLIAGLSAERPHDVGTTHLRGWRLLREERYGEALTAFTRVLSIRGDHVASLRDAADCLHHMERVDEALSFLAKAKQIESDNPYTLDLEARIYEELGEYDQALKAADLAVIRNPGSWSLRHRRARILSVLGRKDEAVAEAEEAVRIDSEQFTARSTLVSLLLDIGHLDQVLVHIESLDAHSVNESQRQIAIHLKARALYLSGDLESSLEIVERQIRRKVNLTPSYGLLVQIKLSELARLGAPSSATAQVLLQQARSALAKCQEQNDHDPLIVSELESRINSIESP